MADAKILNHDPLSETESILQKEYYGAATESEEPKKASKVKKAKPTHYKVVCISLYTRDIANLEAKVAELKRRGHTKANKSQLIRFALDQLDLDKLNLPNL